MGSGLILAIDPGPVRSAWLGLQLADGTLRGFGIWDNDRLLASLRTAPGARAAQAVVIEKVEGYGMAVGAEVFETVWWSGRFTEAAQPVPVQRIGRKAVKVALCGNSKAKDPNIRQALIDRYGGPECIRKGGPLHGVSKDVWSALAVAVTVADRITELDAGQELGL